MQTRTMDTAAELGSPQPDRTRVVDRIRDAAQTLGVSFSYLLAQATQESGLDPQALNTRSSAAGLFQFTAPTWLDMIRRHGARHGLEAEAAAIVKGPDGKLDVADKAVRRAILDLRKDPRISSMMAAELAKDNARVLERKLGRPATSSDLYLAHFLGAGGAARVLSGMTSDPGHPAHELLPEAARANPDLFRRAETVAGLYKAVQSRFKTGSTAPVILAAADQHRPFPPRPVARPDRAEAVTVTANAEIQTVQAVAAVAATAAPSATPANAFATAIEPESPFFPIRIPPAPTRIGQNDKESPQPGRTSA